MKWGYAAPTLREATRGWVRARWADAPIRTQQFVISYLTSGTIDEHLERASHRLGRAADGSVIARLRAGR